MERNVDKIKKLTHELGRYRKKVTDQAREIGKLREQLKSADAGNQETQALVDALLTAIVLEHGERATDPDEPEKVLGGRLAVHRFAVQEIRERYEIHARKDPERDMYVLGVMERKGAEHDAE